MFLCQFIVIVDRLLKLNTCQHFKIMIYLSVAIKTSPLVKYKVIFCKIIVQLTFNLFLLRFNSFLPLPGSYKEEMQF